MGGEGENFGLELKKGKHGKKKKEDDGEIETEASAENEKENVIEDNEIGKDADHSGREGNNKNKRKKKKEMVDADVESFIGEVFVEVPNKEKKKITEDNAIGNDRGHKGREGKEEKSEKKKDEVGRARESFSKKFFATPNYERKKVENDNVTGIDKDYMGKEAKKKNRKRRENIDLSLLEEFLANVSDNEKEEAVEDNEIGKGNIRRERKKKKKEKEEEEEEGVDKELESFLEEILAKVPNNEMKKVVKDGKNDEDHAKHERKKKRKREGIETKSKDEKKKKRKKKKDDTDAESNLAGNISQVTTSGSKMMTEDKGVVESHAGLDKKKEKKTKREKEGFGVNPEKDENKMKENNLERKKTKNDKEIAKDKDHKHVRFSGHVEIETKSKDEKKKKRKKKKDDTDAESNLAGNIYQVTTSGSKTVTENKGVVESHAGLYKKQEKKTKREKEGFGVNPEKDENKMKESSLERKKTKNDKEVAKDKDHKHVRFSGHVEVFPSDSDGDDIQKPPDGELVQGKRFSPKEDKLIMNAVSKYIKEHDLGDEGLTMILNCKSYPEVRRCWKEIGSSLPWRPTNSVAYRTRVLYQRDTARKWTSEECDFVKRYAAKNGNKWKEIAEFLGKHRIHVKDLWRRNKLDNRKRGCWDQEEYQTLFNLVNKDLQMKAFQEKKTKHGMLRDNICWGAISDKLATRNQMSCCYKWYNQIASSMVQDNLWTNIDDHRLLEGLYKLDVCCIEEVEWDELLDNRSGDICLKRWNQMVKHIGENRNKPFSDQVELLVARFCPILLNKGKDDEPYSDPEAEDA